MAEKFVPSSEDVSEWQLTSNDEVADRFASARLPNQLELLDPPPNWAFAHEDVTFVVHSETMRILKFSSLETRPAEA
jgi:hypothetical protein